MKDELTDFPPKILPPRGNIRVEFTGKNLTKFGGIQLVRKFFRQLNVKEELESVVAIEKRESKFSVGGMLVCLLYAVILDMKRQSDTLMLRLDKVFQKIAGLDDYPVQSTISRFLKRFRVDTAKGIAKVNHCLTMKARKDFEGWTKITFDLDSHVRTAYGHQQRASVGYNPKKPGRASFHPLFCFIGETRDFLHGLFRTGKAHSCRGVKRFVDECLKKIPEGIREIFLRADSGFYDGDFLYYLGLHEREKGKRMQKNRGAKAFNGEVCSIYRKGIEIMVFQARGRGKEPLLFIEKAIGNKILLDLRLLFVRE